MNSLRILLIADPVQFPGETAHLTRLLNDMNCVDLVAIHMPVSGRLPKIPCLLYRLYNRFDARRAGISPGGARHNASPHAESSSYGNESTVSPEMDLDVVVVVGVGPLPYPGSLRPRFGYWQCLFGDPASGSSVPPGFWEVYHRLPVTVAGIGVSGSSDTARVLRTVEFRSDPTSPVRNRAVLAQATAGLLAEELDNLASRQTRPEQFWQRLDEKPAVARGHRGAPLNFAMVRYLVGQLALLVKRRMGNATAPEQWSIGTIEADIPLVSRTDLDRTNWYSPPAGGFVADPFLAVHEDTCFIFVEECPDYANRGRIACIPYRNHRFGAPVTVLEKPWHLSFPFVVRDNDTYYMVPEQAEAGEIVLYRCTRFPDQWEPYRTLVPGFPGIDPVLLHHKDRWWLFTTRCDPVSSDNNLQLYSAPTLDEEFKPHPGNPVRTGLYGSRMAGRILVEGNRLIRPGQNCVARYGASIVFFEITTLNETVYAERAVSELMPSTRAPFDRSLHTIDFADGICVVDGARLVR